MYYFSNTFVSYIHIWESENIRDHQNSTWGITLLYELTITNMLYWYNSNNNVYGVSVLFFFVRKSSPSEGYPCYVGLLPTNIWRWYTSPHYMPSHGGDFAFFRYSGSERFNWIEPPSLSGERCYLRQPYWEADVEHVRRHLGLTINER